MGQISVGDGTLGMETDLDGDGIHGMVIIGVAGIINLIIKELEVTHIIMVHFVILIKIQTLEEDIIMPERELLALIFHVQETQ